MLGPDCPVCARPMDALPTWNQWIYGCRACNQRYNDRNEPMPPVETLRTHDLFLSPGDQAADYQIGEINAVTFWWRRNLP